MFVLFLNCRNYTVSSLGLGRPQDALRQRAPTAKCTALQVFHSLPHPLVHTTAAPRLPQSHTNETTTVQKLHVSPWFNLHPTLHGRRQIRSAHFYPTHELIVRHPPPHDRRQTACSAWVGEDHSRGTQSLDLNAVKLSYQKYARTSYSHHRCPLASF